MKKVIDVDGITCDHCVTTIKEAIGILPGVILVSVDIEKKQVIVKFDEKLAQLEDIIGEIGEIGFEVRV
jgi:copper chaperone